MLRGCTNAIVVPREPARGVSSISVTPSARRRSSASVTFATRYAEVMHAGPALVEEPSHRRVGSQRPEQLHVRLAHREQHLLDPLIVHPFAVRGLEAEGAPVPLDLLVQIGDGDPDVVDLRQHHELRRGRRRPSVSGGWSRSISSCACFTW